MILTYKVKHETYFSKELIKARKVAKYAVLNKRNFKVLTSKYVKQYGLKSVIFATAFNISMDINGY